jgi:hypothetical protein
LVNSPSEKTLGLKQKGRSPLEMITPSEAAMGWEVVARRTDEREERRWEPRWEARWTPSERTWGVE